MILVDLDDFCEDNSSLPLLRKIKEEIPNFKVNLFTIIGKCSPRFAEEIKHIAWIDMIPHGMFHTTSRECEDWDYAKCMDYLKWVNKYNLTKGFKAPGWQISEGMYRALVDNKYWVADQPTNIDKRPLELKAYILDSGNKIHGHIGHMGGWNANELSLILPEIYKLKTQEFKFIKEII